jgi:hypothetical protein
VKTGGWELFEKEEGHNASLSQPDRFLSLIGFSA